MLFPTLALRSRRQTDSSISFSIRVVCQGHTVYSKMPHVFFQMPRCTVSAKPSFTISSSIIRSSSRVLRSQQLKNMHSHEDGPSEGSNHHQYTSPVRHSPVCNDQAPMSTDARRYDAVSVGMRVRIQQRRRVERRIGRGYPNSRVVRACKCGRCAAVGDGFEVAFGGERGRCARG